MGGVLGATAVAVLAWVLQAAAYLFALHLLDAIAALLMAFGIYLFWEFLQGLSQLGGTSPKPPAFSGNWPRPLNLAGIGF